jgi:DNA-binding NtrC family response regulator
MLHPEKIKVINDLIKPYVKHGALTKEELDEAILALKESNKKKDFKPIEEKLISNQKAAEMLGCCTKTLQRKWLEMGLEKRNIGKRKICFTFKSVIGFIHGENE